jgi:hypothetical protein
MCSVDTSFSSLLLQENFHIPVVRILLGASMAKAVAPKAGWLAVIEGWLPDTNGLGSLDLGGSRRFG